MTELSIAVLVQEDGVVTRQEIIRRGWDDLLQGHDMPIQVSMPCRTTVLWEQVDDVPLVDTPCPCGDERHWVVKYERLP